MLMASSHGSTLHVCVGFVSAELDFAEIMVALPRLGCLNIVQSCISSLLTI